jgi:hypothetical protein
VLKWGSKVQIPGVDLPDNSANVSKAFDAVISSIFRLLSDTISEDVLSLVNTEPDLLQSFFARVTDYIKFRIQYHVQSDQALRWRSPPEWVVFGITGRFAPPSFMFAMRELVQQGIFEPSDDIQMKLAIDKASIPLYLWDIDHEKFQEHGELDLEVDVSQSETGIVHLLYMSDINLICTFSPLQIWSSAMAWSISYQKSRRLSMT